MTATLAVHSELVDALKIQAADRHLAWEDWALMILMNAAEPQESPSWHALNERRLSLIRQKYNGGITAEEQRELAALQAAASKHLEQFDRSRLEWLRAIEERAEQLGAVG